MHHHVTYHLNFPVKHFYLLTLSRLLLLVLGPKHNNNKDLDEPLRSTPVLPHQVKLTCEYQKTCSPTDYTHFAHGSFCLENHSNFVQEFTQPDISFKTSSCNRLVQRTIFTKPQHDAFQLFGSRRHSSCQPCIHC